MSIKFLRNTGTYVVSVKKAAGIYTDTGDGVFRTLPSKSGKGYSLETNYYEKEPYDIQVIK